MTFPSEVNTASTAGSLTTSQALTMPSNITPANLLVAWVAGASISSDTMTDWTKLDNAANGTSHIGVYAKSAVGGDTGTVAGANAFRLAQVKEYYGWDGVIANIGIANASSNVVDPPNLDMTTSREYLWVAYARNDSSSITAAPANYTGLTTAVLFSSNLGVAYRALAASAENPGAFTTGTPTSAVAGVIAIRPALVIPQRQNRARLVRASHF